MNKVYTKDVLKLVAAGGLVLGTVATGPALAFIVSEALKIWKEAKREDLGRIIKRLERQEMISIKEEGSRVKIEVTEKGKKRLLEYDFENIERKAKKRDGKWRLVIFDIPEDKKAARDVFRRKLIELGCLRLQDSVFASAFPIKDEVDFLSSYLGISDYITLGVLDRIEGGEQLIFKSYKTPDS